MAINIEIDCNNDNWYETIPDIDELIKTACQNTLQATNIPNFAKTIDVSVLLTDNNFIQDLNKRYRNKDTPTNVLSFPSENFTAGEYNQIDGYITLGDIILALAIIQQESQKQKKSLQDHLTHLVVHGTLHLLGYDHIDDNDAKIMENLEIKVLEKMNISNPYE